MIEINNSTEWEEKDTVSSFVLISPSLCRVGANRSWEIPLSLPISIKISCSHQMQEPAAFGGSFLKFSHKWSIYIYDQYIHHWSCTFVVFVQMLLDAISGLCYRIPFQRKSHSSIISLHGSHTWCIYTPCTQDQIQTVWASCQMSFWTLGHWDWHIPNLYFFPQFGSRLLLGTS